MDERQDEPGHNADLHQGHDDAHRSFVLRLAALDVLRRPPDDPELRREGPDVDDPEGEPVRPGEGERSHAAALRTGSFSTMLVPCPSMDATLTSPPWASITCLTM